MTTTKLILVPEEGIPAILNQTKTCIRRPVRLKNFKSFNVFSEAGDPCAWVYENGEDLRTVCSSEELLEIAPCRESDLLRVYKLRWRKDVGVYETAESLESWLDDTSKIYLRVDSVDIEQLQDISVADARAEGLDDNLPKTEFFEMWDKLNTKSEYLSTSNPWVWVIRFHLDNPTMRE